jgi:hypothetical protein
LVRDVGIDQGLVDALAIGSCGNADAGADAAFVAVIVDRLADRLDEEGGIVGNMLLAVAGLREDDEFVTADAGKEITLLDIGAQRIGGMPQNEVACRVTQRIVDVLEPVEVDVEYGERLEGVAVLFQPGDDAVEVAAVRQFGQRVVESCSFHLEPRPFEFPVLLVGLHLGLAQVFLQADVVGHVPVDADHLPVPARIPVAGADCANVPDIAFAADDAEVACIATLVADRPLELLFRVFDVIRMDRLAPIVIGRNGVVFRHGVDVAHARVPDQPVGGDVVFPDADLGGFERDLQAVRKRLHLVVTLLDDADVALAFFHQPASPDHRQDDDEFAKQQCQPEAPDIGKRHFPAVLRHGGDQPVLVADAQQHLHRILALGGDVAEEGRFVRAGMIKRAQRNLHRLGETEKAAVSVKSS